VAVRLKVQNELKAMTVISTLLEERGGHKRTTSRPARCS
jgi:hypothetical protein